MSRKSFPEINAGSMADIAFLLLIFFLVTTTLTVDIGIQRKIAKKNDNQIITIKNRNILEVNINKNNEIFIKNKIVQLSELQQIAIDFIDNNCNWCQGKKDLYLSEHPTKAVISLKTDRTTSYETYIAALDKFNSTYMYLRNRISTKLYAKNYEGLLEEMSSSKGKKEDIKKKIKNIQEMYPILLTDAEIEH